MRISNNYLKPDAEKNFLEMCFDNAAEWCAEHWQEIATTVAIIIGVVLAIEAVIVTGGAALVPLLTTVLGVSAGTAATISFTVATIAVASTIGASALNIADTWGHIDNPTFNTWQSALNWTSTISNGLYSIGMLYNSIKYKSGRSFKWESKEAGGTETLKDIKYSPVNSCDKIKQEVVESFRSATFTEKVLTEDTIMYRVSGGKAGKVGSYVSKTPQGGGLQSQLDLALNPSWGNTTENVTKVIVPKGTVIYEGVAAPQNILDSMGNTVPVTQPYFCGYNLNPKEVKDEYKWYADKWYKCKCCGTLWEFSYPDFPAKGFVRKFEDGVYYPKD